MVSSCACKRGCSSLVRDTHGDATIGGAAGLGGIVRNRVLLSVSLGRKPIGTDAPLDEFRLNGVRSILRELLVCCRITDVIGVAADLDASLGISVHDRRDVVELFLRL